MTCRWAVLLICHSARVGGGRVELSELPSVSEPHTLSTPSYPCSLPPSFLLSLSLSRLRHLPLSLSLRQNRRAAGILCFFTVYRLSPPSVSTFSSPRSLSDLLSSTHACRAFSSSAGLTCDGMGGVSSCPAWHMNVLGCAVRRAVPGQGC